MESSELTSLYIPPVQDNSSVGLVALGALKNVHESCLYWNEAHQEDDFETSTFEPQRIFYEKVREINGGFPEVYKSQGRFLYPATSGTWLAGRLLTESQVMCGAVFWHKESVGSTVEDAAQVIQQDVCVNGKAGMYNLNEEPHEFEENVGGRIVGRMTWDEVTQYPRNNVLDDESPYKMPAKENTFWGPDFLLAPVNTYLNQAWPTIKASDGYYGIPLDPNSPKAELWSIKDDKDNAVALRAFFHEQEYLAGRLLTRVAAADKNEKDGSTTTTTRAMYMMILYTYTCPEQLEDAMLEGVPISTAEAKRILHTPKDFVSFLLTGMKPQEETCKAASPMDQLVHVLKCVSEYKILDVLEQVLVRHAVKLSKSDRIYVMETTTTALYGSNERQPLKSAPRLGVFQARVLMYLMDFDVLNVAIQALQKANVLDDLIADVKQLRVENEKRFKHPGSASCETLLALAPNAECARFLLDAGVEPSVAVASATMDRPAVFDVVSKALIQKHDTDEDKDSQESIRRELAVEATKGLHCMVLLSLLESMTNDELQTVRNMNGLFIIDPPDENDQKAPRSSRGGLAQVALGSYIVKKRIQRHIQIKARENSDREALHQILTVLEQFHFDTNVELDGDFWQEMRHLLRYEYDADKFLEDLRQEAEIVTTSRHGGRDEIQLELQTMGRLEIDLATERKMQEAQGSQEHNSEVSRHWYMEAAQKVNNVY